MSVRYNMASTAVIPERAHFVVPHRIAMLWVSNLNALRSSDFGAGRTGAPAGYRTTQGGESVGLDLVVGGGNGDVVAGELEAGRERQGIFAGDQLGIALHGHRGVADDDQRAMEIGNRRAGHRGLIAD